MSHHQMARIQRMTINLLGGFQEKGNFWQNRKECFRYHVSGPKEKGRSFGQTVRLDQCLTRHRFSETPMLKRKAYHLSLFAES